jgi:hypothetical protein
MDLVKITPQIASLNARLSCHPTLQVLLAEREVDGRGRFLERARDRPARSG